MIGVPTIKMMVVTMNEITSRSVFIQFSLPGIHLSVKDSSPSEELNLIYPPLKGWRACR